MNGADHIRLRHGPGIASRATPDPTAAGRPEHCPGCAGHIEPEYLRREPCPGLAQGRAEALDPGLQDIAGHSCSQCRRANSRALGGNPDVG